MARFLDKPAPFQDSDYKMILFDLDGTLLKENREISPNNLRTLKRLMSTGVKVGFATGRTLASVKPYVEALDPNGPLILFNGARVWDRAAQTFIYENLLSFEQAYCAMKLVREFDDVHVNLYVDNEIYISKKTPRSIESELKDGVPHNVVGDLANWLERRLEAEEKKMRLEKERTESSSGSRMTHHCYQKEGGTFCVKIMLIGEPDVLDIFEGEFKRRVFEPCSLIHSEWNYLEIMQNGINKGQTLKRIEEHYGIPCSKIISFGDNLNDIDLIRFSGLGVAMANAHGDLKAIARKTIGHHETDTIHEFLSSIFP